MITISVTIIINLVNLYISVNLSLYSNIIWLFFLITISVTIIINLVNLYISVNLSLYSNITWLFFYLIA